MAADTHLMLAKNPGYLLLILASLMAVCIVPAILAEIYHEVRFVEMPQYSVALPGDSVYFSCATNLPTSLEEITWLHNGQVLNDQQDFNIDQGQLTFKISTDPLVYKSQEGSYQCIGGASGSKFKIASIAAELNIAFLGDFRGQPVNKRLEIFEGNDAVVPCQVPESIPPAFVHFLRNDDEENYDNDNAGGKILNGDTLLLQNTSMSMSGNYSCVVSNHITNQRKKSLSVVSLKVQNATGKNEKSRMIYSPKDNYEVRVGEDLQIPCTASGVPRPEIIWSKMINGVFSQVNHTNRSGVLQFTSIASNDSGHYMCAVFNGGRRYVRRTTISVVVPPQHVLVNRDVYLHVREGDSIELPCQASGSPPPFIQWRFNGQPVSGLASADVNRITGKLVILNAIADDHTGFYQCFARNKAGEVVAQAFVQVGEDILRDDKTGDNDYENLDQDLLETTFQDFQGHVVVSPTRPNVTQVNPESIIVRWELKKPEDYAQPLVPVKFFKIQFREFFRGGKGRSAWHTVEEDIDPFNRAFEIFGLHSDRKYRFRIIVGEFFSFHGDAFLFLFDSDIIWPPLLVYENNDSQTSPLSRKFRLNANFANGSSNGGGGDLLSPRPKPPAKSPQILGVVPLGPTTLRLGWVLDTSANEEVEGYFIFFKPSFEEKFKKVTIIGATSHSHIIEALIPGMEYAIKVQMLFKKRTEKKVSFLNNNFSGSSIQSCWSFALL